jgi:hypothetical protein
LLRHESKDLNAYDILESKVKLEFEGGIIVEGEILQVQKLRRNHADSL